MQIFIPQIKKQNYSVHIPYCHTKFNSTQTSSPSPSARYSCILCCFCVSSSLITALFSAPFAVPALSSCFAFSLISTSIGSVARSLSSLPLRSRSRCALFISRSFDVDHSCCCSRNCKGSGNCSSIGVVDSSSYSGTLTKPQQRSCADSTGDWTKLRGTMPIGVFTRG